jgi:hypothetical protein
MMTRRQRSDAFGWSLLLVACFAVIWLAMLSTGCSTIEPHLYGTGTPAVDPITGEAVPGDLLVNPAIETAIRGIGQLPVPGAAVGAVLLGWLYTGYAARRNRRVSVALIEGIEAGRKALVQTPGGHALDDRIRQALIEHQQFRGVLEYVARLVQRYTEETRSVARLEADSCTATKRATG